jgi:hypothetical protein
MGEGTEQLVPEVLRRRAALRPLGRPASFSMELRLGVEWRWGFLAFPRDIGISISFGHFTTKGLAKVCIRRKGAILPVTVTEFFFRTFASFF